MAEKKTYHESGAIERERGMDLADLKALKAKKEKDLTDADIKQLVIAIAKRLGIL